MKDQRFQNDADTTQDKQDNGCRIHLRFFDFMGEAIGKRQRQEFRGEGDQNEKKYFLCDHSVEHIAQSAENALSQEEEAKAAFEFVVVLSGLLQVGNDEHINAKETSAYAREESDDQTNQGVILRLSLGTQLAGGHFDAQDYHDNA